MKFIIPYYIYGLLCGIFAVFVTHTFVIIYTVLHHKGYLGKVKYIQNDNHSGCLINDIKNDIKRHLTKPEGFFIIVFYLGYTWIFNLMPITYYDFDSGIALYDIFKQLVVQDFIQTCFHIAEHRLHIEFYKISHKPHHRFINPNTFDAFDGSIYDTVTMIITPLFITSRIIHTNTWNYICFGSIYANWLFLIHSDIHHPWDWIFSRFGLGTPGDHHVHHKLRNKNYGHLFMWWDMIMNTYKNPHEVFG